MNWRNESWRTKFAALAGATATAALISAAAPAAAEEVVLRMAVPDWPPTRILKDMFDKTYKPPSGNTVKLEVDFIPWPAKIDEIDTTLTSHTSSLADIAVNVKSFGAIGNGLDNGYIDGTALQQAIDSLPKGGTVLLPQGHYVVDGNITINKPITIQGAARGKDDLGYGTIIRSNTGNNVFVCNSNYVSFRDLELVSYNSEANLRSTGATAVTFETGRFCSVERCRISNWGRGVWFQNCDEWFMSHNEVVNCYLNGIIIENRAIPDAGDSFLSNNFLSGGDCIVLQKSAGGLKVTANKIIAGVVGFELNVADNVSTSVLLFNNNSFEGQTQSCLRVTSSGIINNGTFKRIIVNGNEFLGDNCTSNVLNFLTTNGNFYETIISNNTIYVANSQKGINIDGLNTFSITDNLISGIGTGIFLSSTCRSWNIRDNNITVSGTAIQNAAYYQWEWTANSYCPMEKSINFYRDNTTDYFRMFSFSLPEIGSTIVEVMIMGRMLKSGVNSAISYYSKRIITQLTSSGTLDMQTIGTDIQIGTFDLLFEIVGNACNVKIKRSISDGGATSIIGNAQIRIVGSPYNIY